MFNHFRKIKHLSFNRKVPCLEDFFLIERTNIGPTPTYTESTIKHPSLNNPTWHDTTIPTNHRVLLVTFSLRRGCVQFQHCNFLWVVVPRLLYGHLEVNNKGMFHSRSRLDSKKKSHENPPFTPPNGSFDDNGVRLRWQCRRLACNIRLYSTETLRFV